MFIVSLFHLHVVGYPKYTYNFWITETLLYTFQEEDSIHTHYSKFSHLSYNVTFTKYKFHRRTKIIFCSKLDLALTCHHRSLLHGLKEWKNHHHANQIVQTCIFFSANIQSRNPVFFLIYRFTFQTPSQYIPLRGSR